LISHKDVRIVPYNDKYWEDVRGFIKRNWREDHPVCDKDLFDWQFKGFGDAKKKMNTFLLLDQNKLIGFRGTIPGLYQVPIDNKAMRVVLGGASAMWSIDKCYRHGRLGLLLLNEAMKKMDIITGLGSDPKTSLPFYVYTGFNILDLMHRYVAPLEIVGYYKLLTIKTRYEDLMEWAKEWKGVSAIEPNIPNVEEIASVWEETTFPLRIFSLYRNTDFWRWRYLDSKGYKYLFFGEPKLTGSIVARIEEVITTTEADLNGLKVFRIIEIIPNSTNAWIGENDLNLVKLLQGALSWATHQGCVAVDFYCSTTRFEKVLLEVGLRKYDVNDSIYSLVLSFQPLKYIFNIINAFFRININGSAVSNIKYEDTYMVKSDGDKDRPNMSLNKL